MQNSVNDEQEVCFPQGKRSSLHCSNTAGEVPTCPAVMLQREPKSTCMPLSEGNLRACVCGTGCAWHSHACTTSCSRTCDTHAGATTDISCLASWYRNARSAGLQCEALQHIHPHQHATVANQPAAPAVTLRKAHLSHPAWLLAAHALHATPCCCCCHGGAAAGRCCAQGGSTLPAHTPPRHQAATAAAA